MAQQEYYQPQGNDMPQQPAMSYQSPAAMNEKNTPMHAQGHQHAHKGSGKWTFGLFDCCSPFGTCCLATWCPCVLFGRTYERNRTGEKEPSGVNLMCVAWCATASLGFQPCLQCVIRQNQREQYGIEGNLVGDFCASCWCACCTLVQEDKESIVRQTGTDPKTGAVYQPVTAMQYQ